jgi:hypothetical protein
LVQRGPITCLKFVNPQFLWYREERYLSSSGTGKVSKEIFPIRCIYSFLSCCDNNSRMFSSTRAIRTFAPTVTNKSRLSTDFNDWFINSQFCI